jgi:hypothetical protein
MFCVHGVAETKSRKKERQSKRGCLVLFSTIFNISDLLVDEYVNSYQILVAPCTAVKCRKQTQVMSTS